MKALVVDDESIVLESCRLVLSAEGIGVRTTTTADEALKLIEQEVPDILLIDIKMPRRDGIFLMGEVRKKWPDIPIIAMSGYPTHETISDAQQKGVCSFIAKPFTPDELLNVIGQVLHKEERDGTKESSGH